MSNQRPQTDRLGGISGSKPAANIAERRSAERKPFIAEARVVELDNSATKISARSCDLVVHGCYVDTLNPLPVGTPVRVFLRKEDAVLDVKGNVVYRIPGLGMGIAFYDLTPENQELIGQWLSRVGVENADFDASFPPIQMEQAALGDEPEDKVDRLIAMLKKKGLLSKAEVAILLNESFD